MKDYEGETYVPLSSQRTYGVVQFMLEPSRYDAPRGTLAQPVTDTAPSTTAPASTADNHFLTAPLILIIASFELKGRA